MMLDGENTRKNTRPRAAVGVGQGRLPTNLYRHFDAGGRLLYVGISLSVVARLIQHRRNSPWFDDITRIEIERFPTFREAEAAERVAIQRENPKHNAMRRVPYRELPFEPVTPMPRFAVSDNLTDEEFAVQCKEMRRAGFARGQEIERERVRREAAARKALAPSRPCPATSAGRAG